MRSLIVTSDGTASFERASLTRPSSPLAALAGKRRPISDVDPRELLAMIDVVVDQELP